MFSREAAITERGAIKGGWGPTLRLLALRVVPPASWAIAALVVQTVHRML